MSILKKVFSAIKEFATHFFANLAHGDQDAADQIELTATNVATLIQNVKAYLQSPMGDLIVAVIPGTWDNELKEKGQEFLTKIIAQEATLHGCLALPTIGEQLTCVYSKILALEDEGHEDSFWHKLGVLGTQAFADGKLTFSDAVLAIEFVFRLIFKKKEEPLPVDDFQPAV